MSDKSQPIKTKLTKFQNLLASQTMTQLTIFYIKQLIDYFNLCNLKDELNGKNEVYDELRNTINIIIIFLEKTKYLNNQIIKNIQEYIKNLLLSICKFCSLFFIQYHPIGCGEKIWQFLMSQIRFFVLEIPAAPDSYDNENTEQKYNKLNWKWSKYCSYKAIFFSRCIEIIMQNLQKIQDKFQDMKIIVIGQYFRLIYQIDDYLKKQKIQLLIINQIQSLEILFKNPSKQIMKQLTKQSLQQIMDYLLKLLRNHKNDDIKKRISLLGPTLCMSMIKMNSIQKKIIGNKILNKFSYDMLYKSHFNITQTYYAEWLVKQGFFEAIFQDNCQTSLIKVSDDTFKILTKRSCINKQKFQRFFQILEKSDNQMRRYMFRLIDPFRIDYAQTQTINGMFKVIKSIQFYDQQFFYFYQGISRYASQNQLINMMNIIQNILNQYYNKFESYLVRRRAIQCYAYIFQKLLIYKDTDERIKAYKKVAQQFLQQPNQNRLIMLKSLINNLTQSKLSYNYQQKLAVDIIDDMNFMIRCSSQIQIPQYRQDLLYLIKMLLSKYKYYNYRKGFSKQILISTVNYPQLFQEMLKICRQNEIEGLLQQLSNLSKIKNFSFSCIKWTFIQMNQKYLKPIKKGYADIILFYASIQKIDKFIGIDIITYLIFNSQHENIRRGSCQLLSDIATNFTCQFRQQGQIYLKQYLNNIILIIIHKLKQYLLGNQNIITVKGSLQLIQYLLLSTQYFGVGNLKSHNSQIPRSSIWVKIYNNCLHNDQSIKIFQKKYPSNKTLFQIIKQVANQFKMGPLDMGLEFPNYQIIKYHGLTLEELKLNGQELNAVKLPQSRCKIQPMIINGQLSERAKVIFTQIFNRYAVNGIMTHKQCANYIGGVTLTHCMMNDSRINDLFYRYDTDRDEKITLQDFLRFYKQSIQDPSRYENVERNLYNLHYRSDLLPYNAEIEYNEQILFRYHIWKNQQIYEYLFKLSINQDIYLSKMAQSIILRLPTYDKIILSLTDTLDFKNKNIFQIQYMLTALQTYLNKNPQIANQLINKGNHLSIFQYLSILSQKQFKGQNDKNNFIISLHVLSSLLLGNFKLKQLNSFNKPNFGFTLNQTNVFINIIKQGIKNHDSTLLQPAFILQLTQNQIPISLIQQSVFSQDKDTRIFSCNFLYLWLICGKGKDINLFKIHINSINNVQWFNFLVFAIHYNNKINYKQIFEDKLYAIINNNQNLHQNRSNPIIYGSLKLIRQIYYKLNQQQKILLNNNITIILPKLISNQNRSIAYQLRQSYPQDLIHDLQNVVNIKMSKQGHLRNKFVGIRNLGSICYMNSILQQFYMIKPYLKLVMSLQAKKQTSIINNIEIIDDFLAQLQQMYINLQWSQKQYYDPTKFCLAIKDHQGKPINTLIQQDAHQFLNTIFDKIQNYVKKQDKLKKLQQIFGGKTVTQIICLTCKNKKQVLQHYYHLSVQVKGMKSLKQSFDKLIQIQQISDYFCQSCNKRVQKITKQMLIKQSPQILIINLQRIIFDLQTFLKVKVHSKLQFQQTLDLHSYFSSNSQPGLYKLKGVVIHTGTSEGGHYYSLIKHEQKWYKFNDQSVTVFNEIDIGRQAFGGDQVTDYWGQHSSSTNAYILFYQKTKQNQQQGLQFQSKISKQSIERVQRQNQQFAKQVQFNQSSFFTALNKLVIKYVKQSPLTHLNEIQRLFFIHLKVIDHFSISSDFRTQTITQIKDNFLLLLKLLPDRSIKIIEQYNSSVYKQSVCNNNDVNIREIYAKILSNLIKQSYISSNQLIKKKAQNIIQDILLWLDDQQFLKNLHKSYQYFDLLLDLFSNIKEVRLNIIQKDYLAIFLDLLMGNESIIYGKQKKRVEFHTSQAIPVTFIIKQLINHKFIKYSKQPIKLSEKQSKILSDSYFYRKIMKNKLDTNLLAPIISILAYQNQKYSKMIAEVLLKAMNSYSEIQDKNIVFINIKSFLYVEDRFTSQRIKWILGIPQLQSISYTRPQFGLMTSSQSLVYSYVSSLFYIKDQNYQPFLFTLYEKRKFYNSFSSHGVITLLQLALQSAHVRNYLLSLPAPNYLQKSYLDWIQNFTNRLKIEDHYGLPIQKHILAERLTKYLQDLRLKYIDNQLYKNLPVNKYIIGKNANYKLKEYVKISQTRIDLYQHETYVLENKPTGNSNQSLPQQQFSFSSIRQPVTAKYFLKNDELPFSQDEHILKKLTVLTYQIKCDVNFSVNFKIIGFEHKVYFKAGSHTINTPYCSGYIQDLIDIDDTEEIKIQQKLLNKTEEIHVESLPPTLMSTQFQGAPFIYTDDFYQIQCKVCTYLNQNRQKCEICDCDLFS